MNENSDFIPLISIILPVYNGEKYLAQSIESCLDQTYKNIELIIVNDASSDSSLSIAKRYLKDERVQIISNKTNKNLPASLNIGHNAAKGEFLTWTSDDNYYSLNAIEALFTQINAQQADIIFSDFIIVNEEGKEIGSYHYNKNNSILLENIVRASFLYKKEVFTRNRSYNENLFKIEDYAFWLNASKFSIIKYTPQNLYYYRSHSNSLTSGKTISQFQFKKEYKDKVVKMYDNFFLSFNLIEAEEVAKKFMALHLQQEINVHKFLKRFAKFKSNIKIVLEKYGEEEVLDEIDLRLRYNIQRFKSNHNLKTLISILKYRPSILFKYSKKRSLKILYLLIFKRVTT